MMQLNEPAVLLYFPAAHLTQALRGLLSHVPAGHAMQ